MMMSETARVCVLRGGALPVAKRPHGLFLLTTGTPDVARCISQLIYKNHSKAPRCLYLSAGEGGERECAHRGAASLPTSPLSIPSSWRRLPSAGVHASSSSSTGRRVLLLSPARAHVPKLGRPPDRRLVRRPQPPQRVGRPRCRCRRRRRVRALLEPHRPGGQAVPQVFPGAGTVVHVAVPVEPAQLVAGGWFRNGGRGEGRG